MRAHTHKETTDAPLAPLAPLARYARSLAIVLRAPARSARSLGGDCPRTPVKPPAASPAFGMRRGYAIAQPSLRGRCSSGRAVVARGYAASSTLFVGYRNEGGGSPAPVPPRPPGSASARRLRPRATRAAE